MAQKDNQSHSNGHSDMDQVAEDFLDLWQRNITVLSKRLQSGDINQGSLERRMPDFSQMTSELNTMLANAFENIRPYNKDASNKDASDQQPAKAKGATPVKSKPKSSGKKGQHPKGLKNG